MEKGFCATEYLNIYLQFRTQTNPGFIYRFVHA